MSRDDIPEDLRRLILNSKEPFLMKHQLHWGLLEWSLKDWQRLLKDETLIFRCGKKAFTKEPQWERATTAKHLTFEEFLLFAQKQSDEWMYFDYKYLREWFAHVQELKDNISWKNFGFPELEAEDSTIWIGSEGAHTPCHVDTYGCNLIAQVCGRKQWILCPPEEDLLPTRVPYEESSIYSSLNFFSPDPNGFKGIKNCRKVVLEPGDVLYVPHKWWHFVENLDTAVSINVWIPLPVDDGERMKESLVQLFMAQIVKDLDPDGKRAILNPNSDGEVDNTTLDASLNIVKKCKSVLQSKNQGNGEEETAAVNANAYFEKYSFLKKIAPLSDEEFLEFLQDQRNRFTNQEIETQVCNFKELIDLINAFAHSETVSLITNKMLK